MMSFRIGVKSIHPSITFLTHDPTPPLTLFSPGSMHHVAMALAAQTEAAMNTQQCKYL